MSIPPKFGTQYQIYEEAYLHQLCLISITAYPHNIEQNRTEHIFICLNVYISTLLQMYTSTQNWSFTQTPQSTTRPITPMHPPSTTHTHATPNHNQTQTTDVWHYTFKYHLKNLPMYLLNLNVSLYTFL